LLEAPEPEEVKMGGRTGKKTTSRGNHGRQIFDQVEQLTADGKLNKLTAFKQIAAASGRSVGTVAANYYRIARKQGAPLRPRRARGSTSGRASSRILTTLRLLERQLAEQQEEIRQLRKENLRFAQLRRLLS
jgi:hypothetical protein